MLDVNSVMIEKQNSNQEFMTVCIISLVICSAFFWMVPLLEMEQMAPHQALQWNLGQHFCRDSVRKGFLFLSDLTFLFFTAVSCYCCQAEVAIIASAGAAVAAKFSPELMFIFANRGSVMGMLIPEISLLGLSLFRSALKSLACPWLPAAGPHCLEHKDTVEQYCS